MPEDTSNAPDRAAGILRDSLDIWVTQGKRLHDRSRSKLMWSPEDIVGDTTDLVEHVTPLVERTIQLGLDLVRPWAVQFEARATPPAEPAEVPPDPPAAPTEKPSRSGSTRPTKATKEKGEPRKKGGPRA